MWYKDVYDTSAVFYKEIGYTLCYVTLTFVGILRFLGLCIYQSLALWKPRDSFYTFGNNHKIK